MHYFVDDANKYKYKYVYDSIYLKYFQMTAELQVPSPLVPTRESYFVRYCKQHGDGTWAVVDVSLDNLRPSPSARSRRRPSGCLIQEMPNGYSKVTTITKIRIIMSYMISIRPRIKLIF